MNIWIISGNLLTLVILQQKDLELKPIFRNMLSLLLLSDTSCIILTNLMFSLPVLSINYALYIFPHLIPVLLPITQASVVTFVLNFLILKTFMRFLLVIPHSLHLPTQIFLTISVYTTIGVAVERFVSISTHTPQNRVGEAKSVSGYLSHLSFIKQRNVNGCCGIKIMLASRFDSIAQKSLKFCFSL